MVIKREGVDSIQHEKEEEGGGESRSGRETRMRETKLALREFGNIKQVIFI